MHTTTNPGSRGSTEPPSADRPDRILSFLAEHGPSTGPDIGRALRIPTASMPGYLQKLELDGLIVTRAWRQAARVWEFVPPATLGAPDGARRPSPEVGGEAACERSPSGAPSVAAERDRPATRPYRLTIRACAAARDDAAVGEMWDRIEDALREVGVFVEWGGADEIGAAEVEPGSPLAVALRDKQEPRR